MYLLPIEVVKDFINPFYLTYRSTSKLLGFIPCSEPEDSWTRYYSVDTPKGRVVPVFYDPQMIFDDEDWQTVEPSPALFFMGSDDGHTGLHFASEEEAIKWLDECPINDFELLFRLFSEGKITKHLHYHN